MLEMSPLPKTWLLDADGTIVRHNGHKAGGDALLPGVKEFFGRMGPEDKVIVLTSRGEEHRAAIEDFLRRNGLRCDGMVCGLPCGERILVNDRKPSGLATAYAMNKDRDADFAFAFAINEKL
ncbi:MAG: hypothetical protein LBO03_07800 [Acidaminococcales bacterium]|jgi:hypothetical protein|nr:hypothetical protein [Acidaminococcales bacterium]